MATVPAASIAETGQYLSAESSTARWTAVGETSVPSTTWMTSTREKTMGYVSAWSALVSTRYAVNATRFLRRIETTSIPVQPARDARIVSMGDGPAPPS